MYNQANHNMLMETEQDPIQGKTEFVHIHRRKKNYFISHWSTGIFIIAILNYR
jgi:hypothetical protein